MISKKNQIVIGSLNKRIKVYFGQKTSDGMGGFTVNDELIFTTWGMINPISADRLMEIDRSIQNTTHEITMRYRPNFDGLGTNIDNRYRLESGGKKFIINTVINNSLDNYTLTVMATQENYDTY